VDPHRFDAHPYPDLDGHQNGNPDPDQHQHDADPQHWSKGTSGSYRTSLVMHPRIWIRTKIFELGMLLKIQSALNLTLKFFFYI
jgi:hypothetical protein